MGKRICEMCSRLVDIERSALCSRCAKEHGKKTNYSTSWERVEANICDYMAADGPEDYRRAVNAIREAAKDWVKKGAR